MGTNLEPLTQCCRRCGFALRSCISSWNRLCDCCNRLANGKSSDTKLEYYLLIHVACTVSLNTLNFHVRHQIFTPPTRTVSQKRAGRVRKLVMSTYHRLNQYAYNSIQPSAH
eukprot:scaffold495_cov152-Skeletonema_menzelii.AAC.15